MRRSQVIPAILAAIAAVSSLIALRASIVRFAPRSAIVFDAVGIPVNLFHLDIARATARLIADGDRRVLLVEGEVVNHTSESHVVPPMRVVVRSVEGRTLYTWTTASTRQKIAPGDSAAFSARLASPPIPAADVVVEFDSSASPAKPAPDRGKGSRQGSRTESQ